MAEPKFVAVAMCKRCGKPHKGKSDTSIARAKGAASQKANKCAERDRKKEGK